MIGNLAAVARAIRMRHLSAGLVLAAMLLAGAGCDQKGVQDSAKDEAPLLLDDEPLLLDDDPASSEKPRKGADNSRCFVCHINYVKEELAVDHALADIGCAKCHGVSDAHIADESWADGGNGTAPEIMYPRPKINPFCPAGFALLQCIPLPIRKLIFFKKAFNSRRETKKGTRIN